MITSNLLKGENIRLTAIKDEDIKIIIGWYEDGSFSRYFDVMPSSPKTEEQITKEIKGQQEGKNSFAFAIRSILTEEILGYIELDGIIWNQGVATVGIGLGNNSDRGKGYGKEALRLIQAFAFKELNLHRLQLNVISYNQGAISAYEKVGFKREGTYREFVNRDGRRWDLYLYGLLRQEYFKTEE